MRFVVVGAGAIGGVLGGRLAESGHDVTLVARGDQLRALRADGLTLETPSGVSRFDLRVEETPAAIDFDADTVALLCVKSQHTAGALEGLALAASPDTAVVCVQNGVANEPAASRWFRHVYAVPVMCPATHLTPGVVQAHSEPTTGILDIGRYPTGRDDRSGQIARALRGSTFLSEARSEIMRWKYRKLITNLGTGVEAIAGRAARGGKVAALAAAEGEMVLAAAEIDVATVEEDRARRGEHLRLAPIAGRARGGGSAWQSLERRAGSIETDYLNGEIVRLGRGHGVPTPVNEVLQIVARRMAAAGDPPGSIPEEDLLAMVP